MKVTIETRVTADFARVWSAWNTPEDIMRWNSAQDDWHTTRSEVDLRVGGRFVSRMEAKDGSVGFDFGGVYTRIVPQRAIEYRMDDGREVLTEFTEQDGGVHVKTTFDAESENPPEMQRAGWQAILDHFKRHVEASR
ncbi:MAG: ATPase [Lysobacteraceae bacterium]|nr:MAG: ATPase [Xanthomonadaceae bacterium]